MSENETCKRDFVRALVDRSPEPEPEAGAEPPAADSNHERRRLVAQLLNTPNQDHN